MSADAMPFTPESANSSCQVYTTRSGETLTRLSALGLTSVSSILKDNWNGKQDLLNLRPGTKVRMCNTPLIPKGV